MASTDKEILCVLGASGVQGSGVIAAVIAHPILSQRFTIRALSRNPAALRERYGSSSGIEFGAADLDSLPSLKQAFTGAHTVFGLTNYYETRSLERDVQQGKNIADAAVSSEVKHLIWSTMRFASEVSDEEIMDAPGLDGKAMVSRYIDLIKRSKGMKVTHLLVGFYLSNLPRIFGCENSDGRFEVKFPWNEERRLPLVDAAVDVGRFVAGVLMKGLENMDGRWVQCVSNWCTPREICDGWEQLMARHEGMRGKPLVYEEISKQHFEDMLPEPLQIELLGNLVVIVDKFELFGKGTQARQETDDEIVKAAGMEKSSWVEYLKRDFEKDFAQPMFPPFMYPGRVQAGPPIDTKEANEVVREADGEISPVG